jgi:hypothetical protein
MSIRNKMRACMVAFAAMVAAIALAESIKVHARAEDTRLIISESTDAPESEDAPKSECDAAGLGAYRQCREEWENMWYNTGSRYPADAIPRDDSRCERVKQSAFSACDITTQEDNMADMRTAL